MKLSRTIAYGIHAALQLGQTVPGVPIPSSQLAREGNLPERFLVQILRCLVTSGVLHSTCGVAGGYYLARSPKHITLLDIIEAFDNPLAVGVPELDCMPADERNRITQALREAASAARHVLKELTLAELIRAQSSKEAAGGTTTNDSQISFIKPHEYEAQDDYSSAIR